MKSPVNKQFVETDFSKFFYALALLCASILLGIIGFRWLEGYDYLSAFYMTVITISTVGFNEVKPLSDHGRLFTSIYILFNLGIFAYVVSVISTYLFEGELNKVYKKYLSGKELKKMKNHVIVCGFGRNGRKACDELIKDKVSFVLVEKEDARLQMAESRGVLNLVAGDVTSDDILMKAGIKKATSIITTLPNDAENVFLALTAKELNPNIYIVARASKESSEKKLIRAGANKVIMPDTEGGIRMAQHITKPFVIEYLDALSGTGHQNLVLEEVKYQDLKTQYQNRSLLELDIRKKTGVSVIGMKREGEKFIFNPVGANAIEANCVIIIVGVQNEIDGFKKLFLN